jgi:hypothetical protein
MTCSFSGPSVGGLYSSLVGAMFVGVVYSSIAKTNRLPALILMKREVANWALYQFACGWTGKPSSQRRAKIYAATNLTVNIVTLMVLRRLQLIGQMGTAVFTSLMAIEMACQWVNFSHYRATN